MAFFIKQYDYNLLSVFGNLNKEYVRFPVFFSYEPVRRKFTLTL